MYYGMQHAECTSEHTSRHVVYKLFALLQPPALQQGDHTPPNYRIAQQGITQHLICTL